MKTRFFAAPALVLFAVLFTQVASAESMTTETADAEDAGNTTAMFKSLDTDNNGYISAEEANANPALAEAFGEADTNGDGQLSMEEFAKIDLGAE
jgi:Ca2+-binding EF-hand superfamily protein